MKNKKALFYSHGGSLNHGCEAIVRGSIKILNNFDSFKLASKKPTEDYKYKLNEIIEIIDSDDPIQKMSLRYALYWIKMKFVKSDSLYYNEIYNTIPKKAENCDVAFSIGGDNYCYKGFNEDLKVFNQKLNKISIKKVLWGCSIEPTSLTVSTVKDLFEYDLIIARESITYNALLEKGMKNVKLYPDPAFQLDRIDMPLPIGFEENNTVGINVSPLIIKNEKQEGITLLNYINLITHIIENTKMQVALIPHVVWDHNDDRVPLKKLYALFTQTNRVVQIQDSNAMELKGYIARCRFFVAARTHASIAAYSEMVPTLVVGYSVKARGIATDIFGTDKGFVIPVQDLKNENDLKMAFNHIMDNEIQINELYANRMASYKSTALNAKQELVNL